MRVPLTIAARNEERTLGACLDSLLESAAHATARLGVRFDPLVVLDDCTDGTAEIARARSVPTVRSSGGKVEAQRAGLREGPFAMYADADVLVTRPTLAALAVAMLERPEVVVASPPRRPLPPVSAGRLARALHVYNRERGFSSERRWFSGKCFAIRRWSIPTRDELRERIAQLPTDRFHDYAAGMRVDDVYLSRLVMAEHGPRALLETQEGCVLFRAPETLRGMYRYYRRMRMELDRVSALFPELEPAHVAFGTRRPDRLARASREHRARYLEFLLALWLCRARYRVERVYYRHFSRSTCPAWPPIEETKCSLGTATGG
jgi:glycosyltransferase involved in cell wall biosynthesis